MRRSYAYEVVDIALVPEKFKKTILDDAAIKKELSISLSTEILYKSIDKHPEKIISGLTFTSDFTHVGR